MHRPQWGPQKGHSAELWSLAAVVEGEPQVSSATPNKFHREGEEKALLS